MTLGFVPPPYPHDRLDEIRKIAEMHPGGCVDLSVGTPCDPPPPAVVEAMAKSDSERGYPPPTGRRDLKDAVSGWLERRFAVRISPEQIAACVGTKEFVAGVPHLLRLRFPQLDTVLYPEISYPTYAMGAVLAGARPVPVRVDSSNRLDLASVDPADARRALCLWVNTPANPTGALDDLGEIAEWGRAHGVTIFSDECYADFTWSGPPRSILEHGSDGVVAVHSLSKRSNLAGVRAGFYAGDKDLVTYLAEVRKHSGLMVPGPVQAGAVVAYGDDDHVETQRQRYHSRLELMARILSAAGYEVALPGGGFYLWIPPSDGDSWAMTRRLAAQAGVLASPGEFYGDAGAGHVRLAMVQPEESLALVGQRLGIA